MNVTKIVTSPALSLTIGLAVFPLGLAVFSFVPSASAECYGFDSFRTCRDVERRINCTWKKGAFGMQYKSCSAQERVCSQDTDFRKSPPQTRPRTCSNWKNTL